MNYIFKLLLLVNIFISGIYANQNKASEISLLSAKVIYDFNYDSLEKILTPYLKNNKLIQSLIIKEEISGKIIYSKKSLSITNKVKRLKYDIKYNNEIVGVIEMSYIDVLQVPFTKEEKNWLKNNKIIKMAVMDYWPHDKNGNSLHTEVLKLLNKYGNTNFVAVKFTSWQEGFKKASTADDVHGIMGLSWSLERETKYFNYSISYDFTPSYLIVRNDNTDIKSLKDLNDKTVYLKSESILHKMMKKKSPLTKIVDIDTVEMMYHNLSSNNDISAMLAYFIDTDKLKENNLKIVETLSDKYGEVYMGTHHKYPFLVNIINKIFAVIPKKELSSIRDKNWNELQLNNKITISNSELKYLKNKEVINICINPNWEPIEFNNNGIIDGISIDILNIIKPKLKIKYNYIKTKSWEESQNFLKDKKCDILPSAIKTTQREKYAVFTKPYLKYTLAVITKDDKALVDKIESIKSKMMSRNKGSGLISILKTKYPSIKITETSGYEESLEKVINGDVYFTISTIPTFSYYKSKNGLNNLQVAGYIDISYDLSIAVRNDDKKLMYILDKALKSIPKSTFDIIHDKWSGVKTLTQIDWDLMIKIFALFVLFLFATIFWVRKLAVAKEIAERATKEVDLAKKEVEAINKQTRQSIEYASLIQGALLPEEKIMSNYFNDYFVHWLPKDTVGGDIWLLSELRNKDECLLFYIDCTGHGVPGAFVTMIVKTIEREILLDIKNNPDADVSPALVMKYFNQTMKVLLKQETKESKSNAGWDGGIIYYNKKKQVLKFAGAETSLFYIDEYAKLNILKGNRYSVGYKKCDMNYKYKESVIKVTKGMKFYCTTDGFIDQNGGEKDFPFGKKRFTKIIEDIHTLPINEQKNVFIDELNKYQAIRKNNDRNDDITLIGFEIGDKSSSTDVLFRYTGIFTQNLIVKNTLKLEKVLNSSYLKSAILTLVIELMQNIMNYAKAPDKYRQLSQEGFIEVLRSNENKYFVNSKNIISFEDKIILESTLNYIITLSDLEIREKYKELKRVVTKSEGIGFYSISKLVSSFKYNFHKIEDKNFIFEMKCILKDN